ncbi:MAG: hypothetical protein K6T73_09690 [Candidatus Bathyarchaeota archaeon]|nr:hypothetical protein [Candidatus Bathyarchaeota archaeon]
MDKEIKNLIEIKEGLMKIYGHLMNLRTNCLRVIDELVDALNEHEKLTRELSDGITLTLAEIGDILNEEQKLMKKQKEKGGDTNG